MESYRHALALRPGDSFIPTELGRCQRKIGELEAALDLWKDADAEYKPARDAKARLAELVAAS